MKSRIMIFLVDIIKYNKTSILTVLALIFYYSPLWYTANEITFYLYFCSYFWILSGWIFFIDSIIESKKNTPQKINYIANGIIVFISYALIVTSYLKGFSISV